MSALVCVDVPKPLTLPHLLSQYGYQENPSQKEKTIQLTSVEKDEQKGKKKKVTINVISHRMK